MLTRNYESRILPIFLLALCAFLALEGAPALAAGKVEVTVFGPATFFDLGDGAKQTKTFSIANTGLPFTLRLQNNGADHAQVRLNGNLLQSNGLIKNPKAVTFTVTLAALNEIEVKVRGPGAQSSVTLSITAVTGELPPDPASVAPALDPSVPTTVAASTAFLYSGANPIQKGVAAGTIRSLEATLARGRVLDPSGQALPGVSVNVQDRPEFGSTVTNSLGEYNLVLNGGTFITLNFALPGHILSSRSALPVVGRYSSFGDVILVPLDPNVGRVGLGSTNIQVVRGSEIQVPQKNRRITLLIPAATTARLVNRNGSSQAASSLSVRATDLTAIGDGKGGIPAEIPNELATLYAFELSADEAISAGGATVQFSQPIFQYTENFLDMPTGTAVPLRYYDRSAATWLPSPRGVNVKILSVVGGGAVIDVEGSGQPATPAELSQLGITPAELQQLGALYVAGAKLSRMPISHFTPYAYSYSYAGFPGGLALPTDYISPGPFPSTLDRNKIDSPTISRAPSVEIQNQTLRQRVPVVGTPYALNYASDRNPARGASYGVAVPITPHSSIPGLDSVFVEVRFAGTVMRRDFGPAPDQSPVFNWDGRDAFGRQTQGAVPADIGVAKHLSFPLIVDFYWSGEQQLSHDQTYWLVENYQIPVGTYLEKGTGLGGFSLDRVHHLDPVSKIIYMGNGGRYSDSSVSLAIKSVPGVPSNFQVRDFVPGLDGGVWILGLDNRLARLPPGGSAIDFVTLPPGISVNPLAPLFASGDGGVYWTGLLNGNQNGLFKTLPSGATTTVFLFSFGGAPLPCDTVVPNLDFHGFLTPVIGGRDGSLYLKGQCSDNAFIGKFYRLSPNGTMTLVTNFINAPGLTDFLRDCLLFGSIVNAGSFQDKFFCTQFGSSELHVYDFYGTQLESVPLPGGVYPPTQFEQDINGGLLATNVLIGSVARMLHGNPFYITASPNQASSAFNLQDPPDHDLVANQYFVPGRFHGLPNGDIWIRTSTNHLVRLTSPSPLFVPGVAFTIGSRNGDELYEFDGTGQHISTRDAMTGAATDTIEWDLSGRLAAITDARGQRTTVERDLAGNPTAIKPPRGEKTLLLTDSDGKLITVTNPNSESWHFGYSSGTGLITTQDQPSGAVSEIEYDPQGRVMRTSRIGQAGSTRTYAGSDYIGSRNVEFLSEGGQSIFYSALSWLSPAPTIFTSLSGFLPTRDEWDYNASRLETFVADGTRISRQTVADDRPEFGMMSPFDKDLLTIIPNGISAPLSVDVGTSMHYLPVAGPPTTPPPFTLDIARTRTVVTGTVVATTHYDSPTRTYSSVSYNGVRESKTLNPLGDVESVSSPGMATVQYGYNVFGDLTSVGQGNRLTQMSYDTSGFLSSVQTPEMGPTVYSHDNAGRVTNILFPDGQRNLSVAYDADGNVISITPPGREPWTFSRDPFSGQMTAMTPPPVHGDPAPPAGGATTYIYNADQNLSHMERPDGTTVDFSYDLPSPVTGRSGVLLSRTAPEGTTYYSYQPGLHPYISSILSPAPGGYQSVGFTYSGSLPSSQTWSGPVNGTVIESWDPTFENLSRTTTVLGSSLSVTNHFNADGQGLGSDFLSLTRDPASGLILQERTNSAPGTARVISDFSYNEFREEVGKTVTLIPPGGGIGSVVYQELLTRDRLGRITSSTRTIQGVTRVDQYTYDPAGRFASLTTNGVLKETVVYDQNGNPVLGQNYSPEFSSVFTYDAQDRLLSADSPGEHTEFGYNANGETTRIETTTQEGTSVVTLGYNSDGALVHFEDGSKTIDYVIDGLGRRVGKNVNGVLSQGYLYDSQNRLVAITNGAGSQTTRYTYTSQAHMFEQLDFGAVTPSEMITDVRGTPILSVGSGGMTVFPHFTEFGSPQGNLNFATGFAGCLWDPDTGLCHFGARDYIPGVRRWLQRSPVGFRSGLNLYGYNMQDPINNIDPSGLDTIAIIVRDSLFGDLTYGAHAGLFLDTLGEGTLYDPGGSYLNGASGGFDIGNLQDYITHHRSLGSTVETYRFKTDLAQELQILGNIESGVGGNAPLFCSSGVSSVLQGIGPFGSLSHTYLPGNLGRALRGLSPAEVRTYGPGCQR